MTTTLAKTPLHDWHAAHGGRLVDFAGWSMPVQYSSIVAEHNGARSAAALFDVSHMGRLRFSGPGAGEFLETLVTRRVSDMTPGQVRYALVINDSGGMLDDVLVYYLPHGEEGFSHLMVVNASNREKIIAWINRRLAGRSDVRCTDITFDTAMIAVQGPLAVELVASRAPDVDLAGMKYYHALETIVVDRHAIVSRTGYTGEDGFELILPAAAAPEVWEGILADGREHGVMAAGLGARDTLRLEAGMPLYGHELSEELTPIEAGLNFAVNLDDRTFPGRDRLAEIKAAGPRRVRIGLELGGKRVPREHYPIFTGSEQVGEITSGTFSPTLQKPIAMGYVSPAHSTPGTELSIDIRGEKVPGHVVKLPFYRRAK